ncbi:hypothetical protein WOLCODRAFT_155207 [Wolfiporia cocos MD-104 SS10]|uniref:Uncharacterized protein n=1 Tax=Wolfiporia cocos (strain MD-104) TaxID=742152 RepID=A0A2H3IXT5_WOLCO|nr:hypothetical protein WOLCODRAFT_155207 [Wolfiporia cocos MD-104 SS10]
MAQGGSHPQPLCSQPPWQKGREPDEIAVGIDIEPVNMKADRAPYAATTEAIVPSVLGGHWSIVGRGLHAPGCNALKSEAAF